MCASRVAIGAADARQEKKGKRVEYLGHDAGPVMEWRMGVRCVYWPVDPGKPDVEKNPGSLPGWRPNLLVETFSHSLQSKTGKEQEISKTRKSCGCE